MSRHVGPHGAITLFGESARLVGGEDDKPTYVVTYPMPVSTAGAEAITKAWKSMMGDTRLIVLDQGATITRLDEPEPTPIYDALAAEFGWAAA